MAERSSVDNADEGSLLRRQHTEYVQKPPSTAEIAKEYRYASAMLPLDERVLEIKHFTGSHSYEKRRHKRASISHARTKGLEYVQVHEKPRATPKPIDRDEIDPTEKTPARLLWRQEMDRSCRKLLTDLQLNLDADRMGDRAHMLRCHHLDKMHKWFTDHGRKETTKEKVGPAYLRYDKDKPTMPGSLRIHRQPEKPAAARLSQSSSSPALISAGMSVLADTKL